LEEFDITEGINSRKTKKRNMETKEEKSKQKTNKITKSSKRKTKVKVHTGLNDGSSKFGPNH
jgi:hypothetical protein